MFTGYLLPAEVERRIWTGRLLRLSGEAATATNLLPALVDCARVYASEGEIIESLQQVFGVYTESPVF